jgi:hypothetical protein
MRPLVAENYIRNGGTHHGPEQPHFLLKSSAPCEAHRAPYGGVVFSFGGLFWFILGYFRQIGV